MKKVLLLCLTMAAMLFAGTSANAQRQFQGVIHYTNPQVERSNDMLTVRSTVDLTELHLGRQQMVIITPEIVSPDGMNRYELSSIVVAGGVRYKMINRGQRFDSEFFETTPAAFVRHTNNPRRDVERIELFDQIRYQEWMREATLVVNEHVTRCAGCTVVENQYKLMDRLLAPVFEPTFSVAYITPPAEEIKQRSDSYSAMLNFVVGRSDIRRDFKDNAAQLDEIDRIFRTINDDKNLTLTEVNITGFASPEGGFDMNMTLSKNRANALADYIMKSHNVPANLMKVSWKGEDWDGLRKAITPLSFEGKDEVISIMDTYADANTRETRIKALNGGRTWRYMLDNVFPQLRRNEYTLTYIARPFDVNEAKEVMQTNPRHLSLNEMFHVANSYQKGTAEFNRVFDIAVRMYPDSEVAKINAAAAEIEAGAVDMAIRRLQGIETAEAWNNLGVAYALRNEYDKAEDMFRRAARAGNAIASENVRQMDRWLQSR